MRRIRPTSDAAALGASYRDPNRARLLGALFPGAGHIYAGERLPGLGIAAVTVWGLAYGVVLYNQSECDSG